MNSNSTVNGNSTATIDEVRGVVANTLGVEDRAHALDAATPLWGHLPELDSMTVLELIYDLEGHFGIMIDGEEVTAELFETLGSLVEFVECKLR